MLHAVNLPLFGELSDPGAIVEIGRAADEEGWDGLFVWDHVLSSVPGSWDLADPWVALAAVAATTTRLRIGPMVTPLARRRVIKVARETVTLDRLSGGRLILGLGLGGDRGRELSAFGETVDAKARGDQLDEGTDVLTRLWAGEEVHHLGWPVVDGVRITPGPLQQPRIPIWFGAKGTSDRTLRRAARFDGLYPVEVTDDQVRRMLEVISEIRGGLDGFSLALAATPGVDLDGLEALGATWVMHAFWPGHRPEQVLRFLAKGPPD